VSVSEAEAEKTVEASLARLYIERAIMAAPAYTIIGLGFVVKERHADM